MKWVQKLYIGASVLATLETIAITSASAAVLTPTQVQFNTTNINSWLYTNSATPTYEVVNGFPRKVLNDFSNLSNTSKAIQALTDNDAATNVELWTQGETITNNVGFSAKLGQNNFKVESVTLADWSANNNQLAKSWVDGFLTAYSSHMTASMRDQALSQYDAMVSTLAIKGLYSAGDPNIGAVGFNSVTGELQVDLVGHMDRSSLYVDTRTTVVDTRKSISSKPNPNYNKLIANPNYLKPKNDLRYATGNALLDGAIANVAAELVKTGKFFQMSEIAKITFNDQVDYAFAFSATDSGAIAGDRNKLTDSTSHTGIYTWKKTYQLPAEVPEPAGMLGLMLVGGLLTATRKRQPN